MTEDIRFTASSGSLRVTPDWTGAVFALPLLLGSTIPAEVSLTQHEDWPTEEFVRAQDPIEIRAAGIDATTEGRLSIVSLHQQFLRELTAVAEKLLQPASVINEEAIGALLEDRRALYET